MDNSEKIFLALAGVVIVALVLYQKSGPVPLVTDTQNMQLVPDVVTAGPQWLVANAPWGYNAALGNPLPSRTNGQVGQVTAQGAFTDFDCGCN